MYFNSNLAINKKDPKFQIGEIFKISIYKNTFLKGYSPNWYGHTLLMILMEKKLLELFTKKNCIQQIKKNLELKK